MNRSRPLNRLWPGDHLLGTEDGDTILASDARRERYGSRKGLWVHKDDLDEPGRFDLPQRMRRERRVSPRSRGPGVTWRVYDQDGNEVS